MDHLVIFKSCLVFKSSLSLSLLHLLRLLHLLCLLSLQVIFFFKSSSSQDLHHNDYWLIIAGSSLDLDRHQVWIIITFGSLDLDHHRVWIIITTGSSLDLERHQVWIISSGSLYLDHHQVWIIICYLIMVLSRFFLSQEVLQSQSYRPTLHVGLHQRLYLTLKSEWPTQLLHLTTSCQKVMPSTHI